MDGMTMHDCVEAHYEEIVSDYLFSRGANPEGATTWEEDYDFMEDKEFLKYAENWVSERSI